MVGQQDTDPLQGITEASDMGGSPTSSLATGSPSSSVASSHDLKKTLGSAFDAMMPLLMANQEAPSGASRNVQLVEGDNEDALKTKLKELRAKKKEEKKAAKVAKLKGKAQAATGGNEGENAKPKKEKTTEACLLCNAFSTSRTKRRTLCEETSRGFELSLHSDTASMPRIRRMKEVCQDAASELHKYDGHEDNLKLFYISKC